MSKVVTSTTSISMLNPALQLSQGKHPLARYYLGSPSEEDVSKFEKRMNDNHQYLVKVLSFEQIYDIQTESNALYLYTEKLLPIQARHWMPTITALNILKGFRRLSSIYGWVQVTEKMIWINPTKQVRVWIHEDILTNQPQNIYTLECQMLGDIGKIIEKYDRKTAKTVKLCTSINTAINCIFTQNQSPLSSRTGLEGIKAPEPNVKSAKNLKINRFKTESFNQVSYQCKNNKKSINPIIEHHEQNNKVSSRRSRLGEQIIQTHAQEDSFLENSLNPQEDKSFQVTSPNSSAQRDMNDTESFYSHLTFSNPANLKRSPYKNSEQATFKQRNSAMNENAYKKKVEYVGGGYIALKNNWKGNLGELLNKNNKTKKNFQDSDRHQRFSELQSQYIDESSILQASQQSEYNKSNRFRTMEFPTFNLGEKIRKQSRMSPSAYLNMKKNSQMKVKETKTNKIKEESFTAENTVRRTTKSKKPLDSRSKERNLQIKQTIKNRYGSPKKCTVSPENIRSIKNSQNNQLGKEKSKICPRISQVQRSPSIIGSEIHEKNETEESGIYHQRKEEKKTFAKQLKKEFNFLYDEKQGQQRNLAKKSTLDPNSVKDSIQQKVQRKKATFAELKGEALKVLCDDFQ